MSVVDEPTPSFVTAAVAASVELEILEESASVSAKGLFDWF
jgi:hypothetical protein